MINNKDMTDTQLSMFEPLTNLVGEDAWIVSKKVSMGDLSYDEGKTMVKDVNQLDDDLRYIEDIVNSYTY
tara:strand:+ start:44 stop:253 length:210 start_codon:yes stop_codon:yes gene_type:complete